MDEVKVAVLLNNFYIISPGYFRQDKNLSNLIMKRVQRMIDHSTNKKSPATIPGLLGIKLFSSPN